MAVSATQVKPMATRVAERVGFDPTIIITIITTILTLLQQCRKPANKNAAASMIDDEFAVLLDRKRKDRCPLQFRRVFRENGITDRDDMNDLWAEIVHDASANRNSVAGLMVKD